MLCIFCKNKTRIYNSRPTHQKTQTWRRHICTMCKNTFTTKERVDLNGILKVQNGSTINPYSHDRLLVSIAVSSNQIALPAIMVSELADSVEARLCQIIANNINIITKDSIAETTIEVLTAYNKNLAIQYVNKIYKNNPPQEIISKIIQS
jgi:transcriptional regulator NrdR family protein